MKELHEMYYAELSERVEETIQAIRRRAYEEGYQNGKADAKLREISETILTPEKQAKLFQMKRDEIVAKAKADVKTLINHGADAFAIDRYGEGNKTYQEEFYAVEHIINKKKNTVVSLLFSASEHGVSSPAEVKRRGIAKCDPSDCFNVHIGKAIALRRALGLLIPSEYLNSPQPTEVRVGDVVKTTDDNFPMWGNGKVIRMEKPYTIRGYFVEDNSYNHVDDAEVIDDSRE